MSTDENPLHSVYHRPSANEISKNSLISSCAVTAELSCVLMLIGQFHTAESLDSWNTNLKASLEVRAQTQNNLVLLGSSVQAKSPAALRSASVFAPVDPLAINGCSRVPLIIHTTRCNPEQSQARWSGRVINSFHITSHLYSLKF